MKTRFKNNILDHRTDDVTGWPVRDADGREIGRVRGSWLIPDSEFVSTVVLVGGRQFRAHDLEIGDGALAGEAAGSSRNLRAGPTDEGHCR